jgi:prephenate dehydratase
MKPVAFQGVPGANSEVAAKKFFGPGVPTRPRETFEEVFSSVERGASAHGIIPIENSLAGSIHQNYDLLLKHRLTISGELSLRIEHALLAPRGTEFRSLRLVRSHPQALAQCSEFFRKHRTLRPVSYFDTAGAAKSISEEECAGTGAIANAYCARLYGLSILRKNIENRENNITRFLAISRKAGIVRRGREAKTSLVFVPARNEVGILFRILGAFALRNVDLVKIESRPDPESTFEYLFYADLAGSPAMTNVANALAQVREMTTLCRILGVYERGNRGTR